MHAVCESVLIRLNGSKNAKEDGKSAQWALRFWYCHLVHHQWVDLSRANYNVKADK